MSEFTKGKWEARALSTSPNEPRWLIIVGQTIIAETVGGNDKNNALVLSTAPLGYELAEMILKEREKGMPHSPRATEEMGILARRIKDQADRKE